jgi:hypothetical protein
MRGAGGLRANHLPYVGIALIDAVIAAYLVILYYVHAAQLYTYSQIYGPLSLSPLIGPLTAFVSASLAVTTLVASHDGRLSGRAYAALFAYSTALIVAVQVLVPDVASRYYLSNWVSDSYAHLWGEGMYLAMYGHLTVYPTFMWFNRAFWFTFAESVLALWGRPGYFMAPPATFTPKWFPAIMGLAIAPPTYLLSRLLGLDIRKAAATVTVAEALWPILPYAASESWATVTFTVTLALFVKASLGRDRRDLALLFLAALAFVYTHEYPAAVGTVALIGAALMVMLRPDTSRSSAAAALGVAFAAWLVMGVYDSYGFVQESIHYYWNVVITTLHRILVKAPQVIAESTAKAYLPYERAVRVDAYTFILDLLVPFALSLAMIKDRRGRLLFGGVGGAGLIGAGLSIPVTFGLGWSYRVPLMLVGVLAVTISLLPVLTKYRRAALVAGVAVIVIMSSLSVYTEYTGYSQLAVPYQLAESSFLNPVTYSGGYEPGLIGELSPGIGIQGIPWYGDWCSNSPPSMPPGLYVQYDYTGTIYYTYIVCPKFQLFMSHINDFANNSTVILDTDGGFLAISR